MPALIAQEGIHDWQAEMLLDADRVKRGFGVRYVRVPRMSSHEGYRDMEEFVGTVEDHRLRNRLDGALGGRGSFRRFKDVLRDHEPERERWFAFKGRREEQRVVEWLETLGIEPIEEEEPYGRGDRARGAGRSRQFVSPAFLRYTMRAFR